MELSVGVTLAVLGAGFLHAGWNALLKSSVGGDALLDTTAVVAGSSLWGLVFVYVLLAIRWSQYTTGAVASVYL